jgi:hypothetical protein
MITFSTGESLNIHTGVVALGKRAVVIIPLLLVEWFTRDKEHALGGVVKIKRAWIRYPIYYALFLMVACRQHDTTGFVYFQF